MSENKIGLRLLKPEDVSGMLEWMHDPEINKYFRFCAEEMTEDKALDFIKKSIEEANRKTDFHFAIVDETDEYLGTISLKNIDWSARAAEYAISLRRKAQGKGIATYATQKILEIAFEELELNRVFLNVLSDNEKAIHLYEKCGFVYEGMFRNHLSIKGKIKSLKWFSLLKEEYK